MPRAIRYSVLIALGLGAGSPAVARPAVVELYTSEACSSCPPAEALLGQLAHDRNIIPLAFHVDYWNGPSWRDPFASAAATERQRRHAERENSGEIYTPEMVVDGGNGFVGSDRDAAIAAIEAEAGMPAAAEATLTRDGGSLVARVGAGTGQGVLRLYGTDDRVQRSIGGGENTGAVLTEFAVVRSMTDLGAWTGTAVERRVPAPAGQRYALVVEATDGHVLAAAAVDDGR